MNQSVLDNLDNLINGTDIAIQDIDRRIDEISTQLNKLPERQRKLVNYERKFKLNDALYTYLLTKRSEVQISKASYLPNNEVVDKARENEYDVIGPNTRKNYLIALLLGLGLPVCIILLKSYFNDKILLNEDIEKITNFPILGHVLRSKDKSPTVVSDYPNSLCAESIRAIRTSFQFLANENQKHIVLVTSSMMKEGKSFTCTNLALSFSLNNKKVLIMNFDLRKPSIHRYLGIESEKGLSSYLSGYVAIEDIILKTKFENVDVILSGPIPPNPMELISSENTKTLFQFLHEKYDYIIIDTPPVGMVADAFLLIKYSDVNIFVVRHNLTMKKVLSQVNQNLIKKGIQNFNIILNDVQIAKKYMAYSHGYGYNYGYGYGYGYDLEGKPSKSKHTNKLL
jgi:capsular exopolysaccharide synthesis family protein